MTILLSLLSSSLMLLPVGVTLGVYAGIQTQQIVNAIHGKIPPGAITNIGPNGNPLPPNVTTTTMYCQKEADIGVYPYRYIYNPNVWGDDQNTGALCLSVTSDTGADPKNLYGSNFTATWGFPQRLEAQGQPVHAFPNVKLNTTTLPIQLSALNQLQLTVDWSYATGDTQIDPTAVNQASLDAATLNANVALDMFVDNAKATSMDSTKAGVEVMVWLGKYGTSTDPIGWDQGSQMKTVIGGVTFNLYYGQNTETTQEVYTWLADGNPTTFSGDVSPLILGLSQAAPNIAPSGNAYLGYAAFGSECFFSGQNVTFAVPKILVSFNGE